MSFADQRTSSPFRSRKYPKWAPGSLVEIADEMRAELFRRQITDESHKQRQVLRMKLRHANLSHDQYASSIQALDAADARLFDELCPSFIWPIDKWAAPLEQKLEVLDRLLASEALERVWDKLLNGPLAESYTSDTDFQNQESNPPLAIWNMISYWLDRFYVDGRPPARKSERLRELATKVRALTGELTEDPTARLVTERAIQATLREQQREFCETCHVDSSGDEDELLLSNDYFIPRRVDEIWDSNAAEHAIDPIENLSISEGERRSWEALEELTRFAFWTQAAASLELTSVLDGLATDLETRAHAETHMVNVQGSLRRSGLKLALTRHLIAFMFYRYGRQFDKEIASIVSAVLDCEISESYVAPERRRMTRAIMDAVHKSQDVSTGEARSTG